MKYRLISKCYKFPKFLLWSINFFKKLIGKRWKFCINDPRKTYQNIGLFILLMNNYKWC